MFVGASYFRAIGRQHVYGLSARGLAIDTAESSGEEFPWFKEFWLVTLVALVCVHGLAGWGLIGWSFIVPAGVCY